MRTRASTRPSCRPSRRRAASRAPAPTCRTSPSALLWGARSAAASTLPTPWNSRRQTRELQARNSQVRTLGERLPVNTVIQGTAADIIKLAMLRCQHALARDGLATRLILTIHDELLFEGPAAEMEQAREL